MADKQYLTAPVKTDKMPPGVPYIVGNEAAERLVTTASEPSWSFT